MANNDLASLRRDAHLPIRLNITATASTVDQVAAKLGAKRINCSAVELFCQQEEKVALLGQISGLGNIIKDVDVIPVSLEELYRHYSATLPEE
ncbi:hypothetical protein MNBD_ALPHA08-2206 [hydrothermal vent metagenome]|uniref:Uncharacterized protein n=1 Tax=hydrothermal vent metagenome TaxID=652676 RepID=A0A3B0QZ63_9ZZZZ